MKNGYTIIEFIIYIAIVIIVLLASLNFAWTIIQDQTKIQLYSELNYNGSFVMEKINYYTNRASSLGSGTYDSNPGTLILNFTSSPTIIIDTYEQNITMGDRQIAITTLRVKEGNDPYVDLTTDNMDVTNFMVKNYSTSEVNNIGINLTLHSINPDNVQMYDAEQSWESSSTIK